MHGPVKIDPQSVYDDGSVLFALDIPSKTLVRARRKGALRFTRKGKRVLYLGQWLLDWIGSEASPKTKGKNNEK